MKGLKVFSLLLTAMLLIPLFTVKSFAASPEIVLSASAVSYNRIEVTVSANNSYLTSGQFYVDFNSSQLNFVSGKLLSGNSNDILDVRIDKNSDRRVIVSYAAAESIFNKNFVKLIFGIKSGASGNTGFILCGKNIFFAQSDNGESFPVTPAYQNAETAIPYVKSLSVVTQDSYMQIKAGQISEFSKSFITVNANYSSGDSVKLSDSDFSLSSAPAFDGSKTGTYNFTAAYKGVKAMFTVTVYGDTVKSLSITNYPAKLTYTVGDVFEPYGISAEATLSSGRLITVGANDMTFSGFNLSRAGTQTVTAGYFGATAKFTIKVNPAFTLGDVDNDGKISSADARLALRASVSLEKLSQTQFLAADTNSDGRITAADARKILRVSVGLEKF